MKSNPNEFLSYIRKHTPIEVLSNSTFQYKYKIFGNADWDLTTQTDWLEILSFELSHTLSFAGETIQERLRKQREFELNTRLECWFGKQIIFSISIADLLPYYFENVGGLLFQKDKAKDKLFVLPDKLRLKNFSPFELVLKTRANHPTGNVVDECGEESTNEHLLSIDLVTEAIVHTSI